MESKKVPDVMWFEFLFDKTGTLLTTHLSTPNAGTDLIITVFEIFGLGKSRFHQLKVPFYLWEFPH